MNRLSKLSVGVVIFLASKLAFAELLPGPLVETDWLAAHLDQVLVVDVRKDTRSFTAKPRYVKDIKTGKQKLAGIGGHVPGASLVNYKKVRATQKINGKEVTRQMPAKADFEALMQDAGVNSDSALVIMSKGVSNGDVTMTTRLYWQLKYYGHDNVAILNGGMAQWLIDKRDVSVEPGKPAKGNWRARTERKELLATSENVADAVKQKSAQLVDTRALSQYFGTGKKSYVYANGHIPGAKVFPNELLTKPGAPTKLTPLDQLRAMTKEMGIDTDTSTITYCNSGHLASGSWFVLSELMGNRNVKLYDGSMHQWTLEKRPVTSFKLE